MGAPALRKDAASSRRRKEELLASQSDSSSCLITGPTPKRSSSSSSSSSSCLTRDFVVVVVVVGANKIAGCLVVEMNEFETLHQLSSPSSASSFLARSTDLTKERVAAPSASVDPVAPVPFSEAELRGEAGGAGDLNRMGGVEGVFMSCVVVVVVVG